MGAFIFRILWIGSIVTIFTATFLPSNGFSFKVISSNQEVGWTSTTIPYTIYVDGSDNFDQGFDGAGEVTTEFDQVHAAFRNWASVEGTQINFEYQGTTDNASTGIDNQNTILWIEHDWFALPFSPPAGALAVTISSFDLSSGEMVDADIHLNGEYFQWASVDTEEEANRIDVQNIVTHEAGHFLGLDHSSETPNERNTTLKDATMYYAATYGDTDGRSLEVDDQMGIQHLYPLDLEGIGTPEIVSIQPVSAQNNSPRAKITLDGGLFNAASSMRLVHAKNKGPDIVSNFVQVNDNGTLLKAELNLFNATPGDYDVYVNNTRSKQFRIKKGFRIEASPGYKSSTSESYLTGGCGTLLSDSKVGHRSETSIVFLALLLFLIVIRYKNASPNKRNARVRFIDLQKRFK